MNFLPAKRLRSAVVTVGAGTIVIATRMVELLTDRRQLIQFGTGALGENGVAGVTVVGFDGGFMIF